MIRIKPYLKITLLIYALILLYLGFLYYCNSNVTQILKADETAPIIAEKSIMPKELTIIEKETTIMTATAYDLSIRCCGKPYGHPARGITASGRDLNNATRHENVVSSNEHPLGTKLKLTFPEGYEDYNGIYTVEDTGNMKTGVLDVFIGDFGELVSQEAINFGVKKIEVEVISSE